VSEHPPAAPHMERLLWQVQVDLALGTVGRAVSAVGLVSGLALFIIGLAQGPVFSVLVGLLAILSATLSLIPRKTDREHRQVCDAIGRQSRGRAANSKPVG